MCPTLPAELIRDIAETAALDTPNVAPNLCLVSHALKHWIEPLLYTVVRIDAHEIVPPALRNPLGHQYPILLPALHRFSKYVRHILIHGRTTLEASQILACCPNLIGVGLWMLQGNPMELFRHLHPQQSTPEAWSSKRSILPGEDQALGLNSSHNISFPATQTHGFGYLSFDPAVTFHHVAGSYGTSTSLLIPSGVVDTPSPFNNVSHLELRNTTIQPSQLAALALLPCLTHMAVYGDLPARVLLEVINTLPQLRVLISFYYHLENMRRAVDGTISLDREPEFDSVVHETESSVTSTSMLCLSRAQLVNILKRWEAMARRERKEVDYWGKAAALVRAQKGGKAPGSGGRRVIDYEGFIGRMPEISEQDDHL